MYLHSSYVYPAGLEHALRLGKEGMDVQHPSLSKELDVMLLRFGRCQSPRTVVGSVSFNFYRAFLIVCVNGWMCGGYLRSYLHAAARPHALKYPTRESIYTSIVWRVLSGTASEAKSILDPAIVVPNSPWRSSNASRR